MRSISLVACRWLVAGSDKPMSDSMTRSFYRHDPTPQSYWDFLRTDAVQYVALPDAPLTSFGAKEAELIATRVPYLEPVWLNSHWTLYEVLNPTALVDPPGMFCARTRTRSRSACRRRAESLSDFAGPTG
jgi:hypothetical protein